MRFKSVLAALFLMAASTVAPAGAAPVTYTLSGFVSGSIDATGFTNTPFTWTLHGDTADYFLAVPGVWFLAFASSSIDIGGVGTATPTLDQYAINNLFIPGELLMVDPGLTGGVALSAPWLLDYDGITSADPRFVRLDAAFPIPTDMGDLMLDSAKWTLTVDGVPEPATLVLFGTALAGAGTARRRIRVKAS